MFMKSFNNPFIGILTTLIVISYILDVWMAAPDEKDWSSIIIIATMTKSESSDTPISTVFSRPG